MDPRIHLLQSFAKPCSNICNDYFNKGAKTWQKADKSFVSEADIKVNDFIISQIHSQFAEDAILSEESPDDHKRLECEYTWVIDPIDGTSEFISGSPEFCVMICLLRNNKPFYANITIPQEQKAYWGGPGFALNEIDLITGQQREIDAISSDPKALVISKSRAGKQISEFAQQQGLKSFRCGSAGVKACRILQGKADNYIHINKIAEWDTAAPDCLLQSLGTGLRDIHGQPLSYNKKNFYHSHFFYIPSLELFKSAKKFFSLD
jgi:3'(2'),5'-bisphosphate nucleotidase